MGETKKHALLSVFNKDGIVDFAQGLQALGFTIVSSGGTARTLKEADLPDIIDVAELTGFPPILDHRVVTLHPKIHGGILARDTTEHNAERAEYQIPRFDLVCVDVYPVWEALNKPDVNIDEVMEMTDIGGPTMLRAAAKNHPHIIVICNPDDRQMVLEKLQADGDLDSTLRRKLAAKVFLLTTQYDAAISKFLHGQDGQLMESIFLGPAQELAYAENRCQNPAHLFPVIGDDNPLAIHNFEVVSGDPSYISLADGHSMLDVLCLLAESFRANSSEPYIVVAGKHGNPCGASIDWCDARTAIYKALMGNPLSVMGGEVITNFQIADLVMQVQFLPRAQINT